MNSNISILSVIGAVCYCLRFYACFAKKGEQVWNNLTGEAVPAAAHLHSLLFSNDPETAVQATSWKYGKTKILKYLSSCLPTASCKSSTLHADALPCLTLSLKVWWDEAVPGRCWASWLGRLELWWCDGHMCLPGLFLPAQGIQIAFRRASWSWWAWREVLTTAVRLQTLKIGLVSRLKHLNVSQLVPGAY